MKKNDIAAIFLIIVMAGVTSYFIAKAVIGEPKNDPVQVEKVTPISSTFPTPDSRVFNDRSVDPTVEVDDDGQSAARPFGN